ncbi:hypothetical protein LIER_05235 [Lithospermum erythrorhizon]|uniref:Mitochondrial protein n=1 Tax=Lithospermum erythrorhizon TaxID=34254 RepID=A0AAV3P044_LITER
MTSQDTPGWIQKNGHSNSEEKRVNIITIRSDHGKEFENSKFHEICNVEEDEVLSLNPPVNDSGIEPTTRIQKDHPVDNIIGQLDEGMTTKKKDKVDYRKMVGLFGKMCFISKIEPKDVKASLLDEHWINAIREELVQFERNDEQCVVGAEGSTHVLPIVAGTSKP